MSSSSSGKNYIINKSFKNAPSFPKQITPFSKVRFFGFASLWKVYKDSKYFPIFLSTKTESFPK